MRITVIIPLFNKKQYVERCLQSVLRQTKRPDRIIVVDDASTDRSADVVRTISGGSVELVRLNANVGPGAARNIGARMARTEWLAFLDADDEWAATFLEEVTSAITQVGADFGSAGRILYKGGDPEGETAGATYLLKGTDCARDLTSQFWRVAQRFIPINSSSAIVSRELYEAVGGFAEDVRRMEDFALWTRLWLDGKMAFVNQPLSMYYKRTQGLSAQRLQYSEVYKFQQILTTTLVRAIGSHRPGAFWLLLFCLRFVALSNASLLKRHVAGLLGGSRS